MLGVGNQKNINAVLSTHIKNISPNKVRIYIFKKIVRK